MSGPAHTDVTAALEDISFVDLAEGSPDAIVVLDTDWNIAFVNSNAEALFGYTAAELVGLPDVTLVPPRLRARVRRFHTRFAREPHATRLAMEDETYCRRRDGSEFPVAMGIQAYQTPHGRVAIFAMYDLSGRRAAEERFQALLESAPDAMIVVDDSERILQVNRRAEMMLGYGRAELIGGQVEILVPARFRERARWRELVADRGGASRENTAVELHALRKDGSEVPVEITLSRLKRVDRTAWVVAARDTTDRRRARQHEAVVELGQLALAGAGMPQLVRRTIALVAGTLEVPCVSLLSLRDDGALVLREGVGFPEEALGTVVVEPDVKSQPRRALALGGVAVSVGADAPAYLVARNVVDSAFVPVSGPDRDYGVLGVHTTEPRELTRDDLQFVQSVANVIGAAAVRDRNERELRESRGLLQAVLDNSPALIFIKDLDGRYVMVNRAWQETFGVGAADAAVSTDADIFPAETAAELVSNDRLVLASGALDVREEVVWKGEPRTYRSLKFTLRDDAGEPRAVAGIAVDMTDQLRAEAERVELERRVQHAARMESVGHLAGGIAHDFNNLLAVIRNYASFVVPELPAGSQARDDVDQIRRAAERATSLTRQLLIFSRREVGRSQVVYLNAHVRDTERLLRRTLGAHIELSTSFDDDLPPVEIDPGMVEQVLINLAVNARDAMPGGGTLTITTSSAEPPGGDGEPSWACVTVTDTGTGMPPAVAERAFEPFFTTKAPGEGTGLGLSTAYGVIGRAGGTIELDSRPGEGTTLRILLPPSSRPVDTADRVGVAPRGRGETVLVAEDEQAVREMIERILSDHGYEVLVAGDGEMALNIRVGHPDRIDLVVTDLVMPKMSGLELAEKLRAYDPSQRVLLISGTSKELSELDQETVANILAKPFGAEQLLRRVRTALDGPPIG